jgi:uncharacterized protein (TIGR03435 family)
MAEIASAIANATGRLVIDQTKLDGRFDYELRWTVDGTTASSAGSDEPPPLFTALQDQLGLKLEPARGPVEVMVIDSAERPTPD